MLEPSNSPPLPYKDCKIGLVIFGLATVLAGLLCALFVPLMFFSMAMAAKSAIPPPATPNLWSVSALYLALAVILVWLGVGSIMARRWACALLAVWSWSWLLVGLLSLAGIAFFLPQITASMKAAAPSAGQMQMTDAQRMAMMLIPLIFVAALFFLLPLIWGLFYSGKNVKATCEARDPVPRWTDRCPLPVLAAVLWFGLGAFCVVLMPVFHSVAPFFGLLLSGTAGTIYYLVLGAIWAYSAWALYRLDLRGWWVSIAAITVFCLSGVITYSHHDLRDIYAAMGYGGSQLATMEALGMKGRTMMWSSLFFTLPSLAYLLYIRKFFRGRARDLAAK